MQNFPVQEIFYHIRNKSSGVDIDASQARNTVSASHSGNIPSYWDEAKNLGFDYLNFVTLISIIFSHGDLIHFFSQSPISRGKGWITQNSLCNNKAFSNIKACARELGFTSHDQAERFFLDISGFITDITAGRLTLAILITKAHAAGYSRKKSTHHFIAKLIQKNIHNIFGLSPSEFSFWLTTTPASSTTFEHATQIASLPLPLPIGNFLFSPRGSLLNTASITRQQGQNGSISIDRYHAQLQNKLYQDLVNQGFSEMRLEQPTGVGTFIGLLCKRNGTYYIYEIKTADTLRACLREALPQLLEYQYALWQSGFSSIIYFASQHVLDEEVSDYMEYLKNNYGIRIGYQQITL